MPLPLGGGNVDPNAVSSAEYEIKFYAEDGEEILGDDIPVDALVGLEFRLDIEDKDFDNLPKGIVDISQPYTIKIAKEIIISKKETIDLKINDTLVGKAQIDTNGTIIITFLEAINSDGLDEDRFVWVEANGKMDELQLGSGGKTTLEFEVFGENKTVNINFEEIETEEKITLTKSGNWNTSNNEITWTISVKAETTPKGRTIENVIIKDTIGPGQKWLREIPGGAEYNVDEKTFTFESLTDGDVKTITVVTQPQLPPLGAKDEDKNITLQNTVGGTFGSDGEIPEQTVGVTRKINFIDKSNGSFVAGSTREGDLIKWTITINNNNLAMPAGTVLEDVIPEGLKLEGNVQVSPSLNYSFDQTTTGFKITFPQGLNKKVTIKYDTKIIDTGVYNPDNPATYKNNAKLSWGENEVVVDEGTAGVGRTVIQKTGNGIDTKEHYVYWKIIVNRRYLTVY